MKHSGQPVNIHIDRCLCGSGRLMRDCCLFVRCYTTPPNPRTDYTHPSCFARDLRDCSRTISREHYISQNILGLFGGRGLTVSGMPWTPGGGQKRVSLASLTGKMLCERHNHALSSLDAVAAEFFRFFTAEWSGDAIEVFLTRGYDLERWLLKMLCGLVVSGNATLDGKPLPTWTPPPEWLEILFGSADVEAPAGLHYIVGNYRAASASLHVTPVFKTATTHPIALVFAVEGIGFLFAMEELPPMRKPSATGADTRYRPMALQLRKDGRIREAHFGWPEGGLVTLDVSG
jgi:hypothetical protein